MSQEASGLLDQIVTASLLEDTQKNKNNINSKNITNRLDSMAVRAALLQRSVSSSDDADESEEEFFEDGDEESEVEEEKVKFETDTERNRIVLPSFSSSHHQHHQSRHHHQDTAAAVLTELSQATVKVSSSTTDTTTAANTVSTVPISTSTSIYPRGSLADPNMTTTFNNINVIRQSQSQSQLHPSSISSQQSHKVRLSGPIRANINIRHGVWAPRLRCRKRKNLHAKDGIWIHPACTVENLVSLVKNVLPDEFEWDALISPLRYQAVNDQSLQSLKTVSGTVSAGQSLYSAFDLVRNRRSDGDNFILQLFVYGTWTVLLKPLHIHNQSNEDEASNSNSNSIMSTSSSHMQPPPKKKYQQAHYHQMQTTLNGIGPNLNNGNGIANLIGNENINPNHNPSNNNSVSNNPLSHQHVNGYSSYSNNSHSHLQSLTQNNFYTHPLAANPPVTFLPTVILEMKMNGTFIPVEISRRSFVAAIRACSLPKPPISGPMSSTNGGGHNGTYLSSASASTTTPNSIHKDESFSKSTICSILPSTNSTPPPSES